MKDAECHETEMRFFDQPRSWLMPKVEKKLIELLLRKDVRKKM